MSLYVGHLSPHVQPDELERVFRRFGRCSFQLKDGYGFVVYEVSANAERALRALRGKQICGEQISLNWSNKQPRPFQRPTRGSEFDDPYQRRVFREDNSTRFRNSQDRRDFSTDVPLPDNSHEGRRVDGATDKEAGLTHEDSDTVRGTKGDNLIDPLMDDEDAGRPKSLDHDRWGEPTVEILPGHGVEKGSEFERYEPYRGYNRRSQKEGTQRGSSDSSPYRGIHGKGYREHFIGESDRRFDKSIPHLTCYNCGKAGHIKRKCPDGDGTRDRYIKFEKMMDEMSFRDKVEGRLKKFRANSWVRTSTSRDPFVSRRHGFDRSQLFSNNGGKSERTKTYPERREKHRSEPRSKSQTKKGTKKKYSSKRRERKKRRARASDTSSTSSDFSKSCSGQSESRSVSDTRSHSTSMPSSRSGPSSSSSRSISISSYAKSKTSRSRSRSMSRPRARSTPHRSLSLSISLGSKSSSSLKNIHRSIITSPMKDNYEHLKNPGSNPLSKMNHSGVKMSENENAPSPFAVENQPNVKCSRKTSHDSDLEVGYNETDACFDVFTGTISEKLPEVSTLGDLLMNPVKQAANSTKISTGEMHSALRHYGLVSAKKDEHELYVTVESYLGTARLWPWEMIYYRRLKRGPISTENYARRLEQNKEFGIADKYIRSSSGWGERQRDA